MKILTAMYSLRKGGAYDRFLMMVEALLDRKSEVHCISLTPIRIENPCYHNHAVFFPFAMKSGLFVRLMVFITFPLYSLLVGWRERVDLFVAFGPLYSFLQAAPKWMLRKPMVTLVRLELSLSQVRQNIFVKVIEYISLRSSDRIIAVNTAIRDAIVKTLGKRKTIEVKVLFNNIPKLTKSSREEILEARKEIGVPEGAKVLVTAGVLTPRKNIQILLKSLSKLGREDLLLLIIGDINQEEVLHYRTDIETLIRKLGLSNRVIITGWAEKEKLWKMLGAADLFVLPSLKEGMPNVMLEALGLDLPCIGSNIPGIREVLQYEELMFDPLDEKAIMDKLSEVFSDKQFSDRILRLCQERKEAFVFDWKEKVFQLVTTGHLQSTQL